MTEESNKPIYKELQHKKEFSISSWAIENRMTVFVITAIIIFSGLVAYISVPKESFPEVIIPQIYVSTAYPGNSPEDIEKLITRPLEKEINSITGIDVVTSTSTQGFSAIDVKFNFDVSPSEALRKVKDKVDIVKSDPDFPDDLPADPNVFEMNFSELVPVMNVNLSGNYSLEELEDYAELLEDKIEDLPQISKVDIKGIMDKEVRIELDPHAMEARQVGFGDVAGAIAQSNMTISGGDLLVDEVLRSVRVVGEFESVEDIENVIVKSEAQNSVYLRDIADVAFAEKDKESYARETLEPVVSLDIIKRAGENLLDASAAIDQIIVDARKEQLPESLHISITNDQSDQTETQLSELENSIIFGVLLVVGVLLFFLGLRNAAFVGIAIPLSMFMSFMILSAFGVTLNVMVLFSLVLALGMLVDNGIVVVENIYRLMDEGYSPMEAAKTGVGEVAWPIIASTATTLAAFVPLAVWPGMMGEFMKYLPITLMIVLGSSLFVALVINPMLTSVYMRVGDIAVNKRKAMRTVFVIAVIGALLTFLHFGVMEPEGGNILWLANLLLVGAIMSVVNIYFLTPASKKFQSSFLPWLEGVYERFLRYAVSGFRPRLFFLGMIGLLFMSFVVFGVFPPKILFFPDIEVTDEISQEIEAIVLEVMEEEKFLGEEDKPSFIMSSLIGQVGNGTSDPAQGPSFGNTPHKARVTMSFVKYQERDSLETTTVLNRLRERLADYPDAEIKVSKNEAGPPQGAPINIEVSGDNYDQVILIAEQMKNFVVDKNIAGIEELRLDVSKEKPELPIIINKEKAKMFGLSTAQIGDAIRTALFGKEISTFKLEEDDYPINIRFGEEVRNDLDALLDQRITFRDPANGRIKQVPISSLVTTKTEQSFSSIKRKDLKRLITLSSNVLDGYNPTEVVQNIKSALNDFNMPEDVSFSFTGQQEEQAKEMAFLSTALLIAVFLIFLIIVAQFNSASTPLIIMFAVLFSMIGVLFGLIIFRMEFVVIMTMIGIISLAGVVVNNAIVLIDYTNLIRERRQKELGLGKRDPLPFEEVIYAVVEAGKTRLRPVLLTAITTVLGLFPLAIGLNIDFVSLLSTYDPHIYVGGDNVMFWGPMSWTIIFGLSFATFLTLVIVPVMYLILAKVKYRLVYKVKVGRTRLKPLAE
jgi:multidrug efflux pump